jgi:subtilisin family serine protease
MNQMPRLRQTALHQPFQGDSMRSRFISIVGTLLGLSLLSAPASAASGTVQFENTDRVVQESAGKQRIAVSRVGGSDGAASVRWAANGGTTSKGVDYVEASGMLVWAAADAAPKYVEVTITDDPQMEGQETLRIVLDAPTGATLGSPAQYVVYVNDNDTPDQVRFDGSSRIVTEPAQVEILVQRVGSGNGPAAVRWTGNGGTAAKGTDYSPPMGVLNWADGDTAPKKIALTVADDTEAETQESVRVILDAPTGATLGSPAEYFVYVTDDDLAPAADADNDGVANGVDNCPLVGNTYQADADGDGIGDACDTGACPPMGESVLEEWDGHVDAGATAIGAGDSDEHAFEVPAACGIAKATVHITWLNPVEDLDVYVTRPDGTAVNKSENTNLVSGAVETVVLAGASGSYRVRSDGFLSAGTDYHGVVTVVRGSGGGGGGSAECDAAFGAQGASMAMATVDPGMAFGDAGRLVLSFPTRAERVAAANYLRESSLLSPTEKFTLTEFKHLPQIVFTAGLVSTRLVEGLRSELTTFRLVSVWNGERALKPLLDESVAYIGIPDARAAFATPDMPLTGKGVGVAIIDTGLDTTQGDFSSGQLKENVRMTDAGPVGGVPSTEWTSNGHGTHLSGTVAGDGTMSNGRYTGVAPGVNLVHIAVEYGSYIYALQAMDYVLEIKDLYNIRVTNHSYGPAVPDSDATTPGNQPFRFNASDPDSVAIKALYDAGIVPVFAAGNSGPAADSMGPDAQNPCVIGVGSGRKDGTLSDFSSRGSATDANVRPDIVAPGEDIVATRAANAIVSPVAGGTPLPEADNPSYIVMSGTSMAAPHIAGVVAILLEADPLLNFGAVLETLRSTARPMAGRQPHEVGAGYVDALAAIAKVLGREVPPRDTDGDGFFDDADNCPAIPNPDQADADGDGLGTACDSSSACAAPGITASWDPAGDDTPPLPTADNGSGDILSLEVAEPADRPGKLIFTMKLRSLQMLPPNVNWYVIFDGAPKTGYALGKWHVEMQTDELSTPSFSYGRYNQTATGTSEGPGAGDETVETAVAGSHYDAATGTITLVVNAGNFGTPGQTLTNLRAEVYQLVGSSFVGGSLQSIDKSGSGGYTLRAAAACAVDTDGDGSNDDVDTDDDNDGVGDGADACAATAAGQVVDGSGCAVSQRDGDSDGISDAADQCTGTPPGETADAQGCSTTDLANASCASQRNTMGNRSYQVKLKTHDGETVSFQVMEPTTFNCVNVAQGAHPLMLHGPGYGSGRSTSGFASYRDKGYTVISWDPRGFGQSSGTVRVMDPEFEGQYLVQILDWAEQSLDYLAWRNEATGQFGARPTDAKSVANGPNLLVGSQGGSYGGGYQLLLLAVDAKKRLDALQPDITWHDLRNSLNPGDVSKSMWDLALSGIGEGQGHASGGSPDNDGQDPFIKETLARGISTNEFPRQALDWFHYHGLGYWCAASGLSAMPYLAYGADAVPMLDVKGTYNVPPRAGGRPGFGDFLVQPTGPLTHFQGLDVLLSQGLPDTLFNFNEAWWNASCLSDAGANVTLSTHNGGHELGWAQSPDLPPDTEAPLSAGNACALNTVDWFESKLRGITADTPAVDDVCFAVDADSAHNVVLKRTDVLAPQPSLGALDSREAFTTRAVATVVPVPNGVFAVEHMSGNAPIALSLGTAQVTGILAGIPHVNVTVASVSRLNELAQDCAAPAAPTRTGCDSISFVGLGVKRSGMPAFELIDDQIQPLRGLGLHDVDLVGIGERLETGDELALLLYGDHTQFFGGYSRDLSIPAVTVSGTVDLPLYGLDGAGQAQATLADGVLTGSEPIPADRDGDGIPDGADNCPDGANPDQADADHDGIGDACEESVCRVPGNTLLTDAAGDFDLIEAAVGGVPSPTKGKTPYDAHDLLWLRVAQPYASNGSVRLQLTLKVASLAVLHPNSAYFVSLKAPDGTVRGVRMEVDNTGGVTFSAYRARPNTSGGIDGRFVEPASLQPIEGSYNTGTGEILFSVEPAKLGIDVSGDTSLAPQLIEGFNAGISQFTPTLPPPAPIGGAAAVTDSMPDGLTYGGTLLVASNVRCAPDDADDDDDGSLDGSDNCPTVANANQGNADGDLEGNLCDADDDNDGVADRSDAFPLDSGETKDSDGDGIGDNADTDRDNDGDDDDVDNCPDVANADQADGDGDGVGDACEPLPKSRVVVAVLDTGINPYHEFYYNCPAKDSSCPSQVTPEILAEFGIDAQHVIELRRPGDTHGFDYLQDKAAIWDKIKLQELYWFKGTNIIARSHDQCVDDPVNGVDCSTLPPRRRILPDPGDAEGEHGVGTSSAVLTANREAIMLFIEFGASIGDPAAETFAFNDPRVDVISTSYGFAVPVVEAGLPLPITGSFDAVVTNGKLFFSSAANSPDPFTPESGGAGPWWIIGVAGIGEGSSNGKTTVSGFFPDFVSDFSQDLPYCFECSTGTNPAVGGTSFATPRSAGVASRVLLEARRKLGDEAGIRVINGKPVMASGLGKTISNWQLRRALEEAAYVDTFGDYDPINAVFDLGDLPPVDAAPWLTMGWGNLSALPEKGVVPQALAHLGLAGTPTRIKEGGFCEFQTINHKRRWVYWNNVGALPLLNSYSPPTEDPYLYCASALTALNDLPVVGSQPLPVVGSPGSGDPETVALTCPTGEQQLAEFSGTADTAVGALPLTGAGSRFYKIQLPAGCSAESLRVELAWDNALEDLDLYVTAPAAGITPAYDSGAIGGTSADPEVVVVTNPNGGRDYKIEVRSFLNVETAYTVTIFGK